MSMWIWLLYLCINVYACVFNFCNCLKFIVILLDIMECKDSLHNCSQVCVELQGEFSCTCYDGYELLEDGVSCKGIIENCI